MSILASILKFFTRQKVEEIPSEAESAASLAEAEAEAYSPEEDLPAPPEDVPLSPEQQRSSEIIEAEFTGLPFFQVGDPPDAANPRFIWKYIGEFLHTSSGLLKLCIAITDEETFLYRANDKINLAFLRGEEMYLTEAMILAAQESQKFEYRVPVAYQQDQEYRENLKRIFTSNLQTRFMFVDVIVLDEPKKHKRRQFNRIVINWSVYFTLLAPDAELFALQDKWREQNTFPVKDDFFRLATGDVSEGGFSSLVREPIPKGTNLSMTMDFGDGQSIAKDSIIGTVVDCNLNPARQGFYNMRVRFIDISDASRSILVRNILANTPPPVNA